MNYKTPVVLERERERFSSLSSVLSRACLLTVFALLAFCTVFFTNHSPAFASPAADTGVTGYVHFFQKQGATQWDVYLNTDASLMTEDPDGNAGEEAIYMFTPEFDRTPWPVDYNTAPGAWMTAFSQRANPQIESVTIEPSFADVRLSSCHFLFGSGPVSSTLPSPWSYVKSITGLEYVNTSMATDLGNMFYSFGANAPNSVVSLDCSSFDTAKTEIFSGMFEGCSNLETIDVRGFVTDRAWDFGSMFASDGSLTSIFGLESFDTQQAKEQAGEGAALTSMFSGDSNLRNLDLSSFSTEAINSEYGIRAMFDSITLTKLALSNSFFAGSEIEGSQFLPQGTFDAYNYNTAELIQQNVSISSSLFSEDIPSILFVATNSASSDQTVRFVGNGGTFAGGSTMIAQTGAATSPLQFPELPTKDGVKARGWSFAPEGELIDRSTYTPTYVSALPMYYAYFSDDPENTSWVWEDTGWRYYTEDGSYLTGGWEWVVDDTYGAHWYYFFEDGFCAMRDWIWDNAWYYIQGDCAMVCGTWNWIDGAWYGFNWDGTMCVGWIWDNDCCGWYYCYSNGVMARNTWVDGYYVDDTGRWIR